MEDSELKEAVNKLKGRTESKIGSEKDSEEYKRPSWDEYFLEIAKLVGSRGTCDRGRNGAVIVKNKRIITTGYVGAPMGMSHCDEVDT
jgi:dCMP deaminase